MKFTIPRATLATALDAVRSVAGKSTVPILGHFLLAAEGDTLNITATDMDMEASVTVACRVEQPGQLTAAADKLSDIARLLPDGSEIAFETTETGRIVLKAGRSRFVVPTLPAKDFPVMSAAATDERLTLTAGTLKRLLDVGSFSASVEAKARPYMNASHINTADGNVQITSTDGKRLSRGHTASPAGYDFPAGVLLMPKFIATLARLVGSMAPDDPVTLSLTPTKVAAEAGDVRLVGKVIDGNPPPYDRVFPSGKGKRMTVDTDLFAQALRRTMIVGQFVVMQCDGGKLSLETRDQAVGEESAEEIEADWSGDDRRTHVNASSMVEALARIRTENVVLTFYGEKDEKTPEPILITETGESDWRGLVMPVHGS